MTTDKQICGGKLARRLEALRASLEANGLEAVQIHSRENSRYFAAFSGTTSEILLSLEGAWIFVDSRYREQALRQCEGYEVIQAQTGLLQALGDFAAAKKLKRLGFEDESLSVREFRKLQESCPDAEFKGCSDALNRLRWIKDEEELLCIREAVRIADEAFAETWPQLRPGMRELELSALLEYNMQKRGASGPSFATIAASGLRSAMPHGVATDKRIEAGDTVTLDFGCIYKGYCSDITRTFFVGSANPRILDIYQIVLKAQLAAEAAVRPGMRGDEGDRFARQVIEDAGYGAYFGHGLGHSLGLAIHEAPGLSPSFRETLPEGVILTVEPGIYVPGLGGVRIEDTCLLKSDGLEVLTQASKDVLIVPA